MTNNTTAPALTGEQLTIQWAIESIEASAKSLQECHTQNGTWGDDTEAQSMFEREMEIASALRALLTSPRAAGLPEGWKLVPIKPTKEMMDAVGGQAGRFTAYIVYTDMLDAAPAAPVAEAEPIPMLLFCPRCGTQHIDKPEVEFGDADDSDSAVTWDNPPHRSHLCHACGIVWRPADVATVGVEAIETSGKADTWTKEAPWIGHNRPVAQAVAADGEPLVRNLSPLERVEEDIVVMTRMSNDTKRLPMEETESLARLLYYIEDLRRAAVSPATADTTWKAPKQHCQNGGDVCLAGNRDGVCCPEDSCDIDDGTRKNPAALPIKIPHVHIRPEDEEIGRQYYALGFVDGSRSITDAPATAESCAHDYVRLDGICIGCGENPATADERAALREMLDDARNEFTMVREALGVAYEPHQTLLERTLDAARASQAAAPQANAAEESEDAYVIRRLSETLADVAVTLRGDDPVHPDDPLNKIELVKRLAEVLRMEVELYRAQAAAPAEAREPVGWFDKSLNQIRWRDGLVNADFADRQPFYSHPVNAPAEAREPIGRIEMFSGKPGMTWFVDPASIREGALVYAGVPADAGEAVASDVRKRVMMHLEDISGLAADVGGLTKRDAQTILNVARTAHAMLAQGAQGGKGGEA